MKRIMIAVAMVSLFTLVSGCSDATTLKVSKAPSFPEGVCTAISDWGNAMVDFRFIGPKADRLFAGTEKSLSLLLKPLNAISREHGVDALGGSCGR